MKDIKVFIFDVETAPMLAYVWGRRDQNVSLNQIKADWYVLAWAGKWLGDPPSKVIYRDQRGAKNIEDDRAILEDLWKLLDEADIVVTQNGVHFDTPKLNARFILHGMKPPKPYKHLDTFQIASKVGKFTSNSLEYLTEKLCTKYKKLKHSKFPGFSLWTNCLAGNKAAWDEMRRYNIHDVLSTEELYLKIRAWAPESAPPVYRVADASKGCSVCGFKGAMRYKGEGVNKRSIYYRYQCPECGAPSRTTRRER